MLPVLKLLVFPLLGSVAVLAGFKAYRYFNERIISSRSLLSLLVNTFLLIDVNIGIA